MLDKGNSLIYNLRKRKRLIENRELIHRYQLSLIALKIAEILRSEGGDRVKVTEQSIC